MIWTSGGRWDSRRSEGCGPAGWWCWRTGPLSSPPMMQRCDPPGTGRPSRSGPEPRRRVCPRPAGEKKEVRDTFLEKPPLMFCPDGPERTTHRRLGGLAVQLTGEGHRGLLRAVGGVLSLNKNTDKLSSLYMIHKNWPPRVFWWAANLILGQLLIEVTLTMASSRSRQTWLYWVNLWSIHLQPSGEPSVHTLRDRQTKKTLLSIS